MHTLPLLVEPAAVGLVEVQLGGEVVHGLELRVEPGLDGSLAQQVAGEGVQRLDSRAVEVEQRLLDPDVLVVGRALLERLLEREAHSRRELARGLLGEGDHGEVVDGRATGAKQGDNALHEHGRLAGARARLNALIHGEVGFDPRPRGGVDERRGHSISPRSLRSCTRGSDALRSICAL